ncbi:MAG: hypothetical protein LQ345_002009 [Seirophora villosa]|nr:MAG: hypothetical protein LQ345_002009 [Seirophora villosa]
MTASHKALWESQSEKLACWKMTQTECSQPRCHAEEPPEETPHRSAPPRILSARDRTVHLNLLVELKHGARQVGVVVIPMPAPQKWKWNRQEMREVGSISNQEQAYEYVDTAYPFVAASHSSMNRMDRPSLPALPVVQGFTPINQSSPTLAAAVPANDGNSTGKKRPRKESKPKRATRPRQPKKPKQATAPDNQDISNAFTVRKPHTDNQRFHRETIASSSPGTARELNSQKLIPRTDSVSKTPHVEPSTGTVQESPITNGLGSIYQAAFPQQEQQDAVDRFVPQVLSRDHNDDSRSTIDPATLEVSSLSPTIGAFEHNSETESRPGQAPVALACDNSCSPGILTGVKHVKVDSVESPAMTASFQCWEQAIVEPDDCQDVVDQNDGTASNVPEPAGFHHANSHNDCPGMEIDHMDIDDTDLSFLLSQFFDGPDEASEHSPERFVDPVHISLSSDVNAVPSFGGDDVKLSSDTTFLEPSSPYLLSCLDQLPSAEKAEVSEISFPSLKQPAIDEDTYNDEDLEAGLLCLENLQSAQVPPSSPLPLPKQKGTTELRWVLSNSISPAVSPVNPIPLSKSPSGSPPARSPALASSKPKDVPWKVSFDEAGNPIPFVRCPYPALVRDRSPVVGLSSSTFLRTCFRVGEALNAGGTALRTKTDAVIELYARVAHSERSPGSLKQHFRFADMFCPDKPPFLKGTYGLWKGVELWDLDSKVFLGEKGKGKMARVVGRMVRDEKTKGLELSMLSVWEADWEDITKAAERSE